MEQQQWDLAMLVKMRKGDRSYERLSRDCGGFPTANRLQQIATAPMNTFPNPETITGLSQGLGATITDVTLAAARSLGLNVRSGEPDALVIAGAGALPAEAQEILLAMARQMMKLVEAERPGKLHLVADDEVELA